MIVEVKKPITKAKIQRISEKLSGAKSTKKPFKASQYAGTVKWGNDAMTIQKAMRDEWE